MGDTKGVAKAAATSWDYANAFFCKSQYSPVGNLRRSTKDVLTGMTATKSDDAGCFNRILHRGKKAPGHVQPAALHGAPNRSAPAFQGSILIIHLAPVWVV